MADLQEYIQKLNDFDVNDIDFDKIGTWPLPGKIFTWLLAFAAVVVGAYFFHMKELNQSLERKQKEEVTLKQTYETKAFEAANLDKYREQIKEMEKTFGAMLSQLPTDTEVPGLLEDIDERGTESDLAIETIELQPEVAREFYVELPIKISVIGAYHDFGTFVSGVAGLPRIVTLHNYSISSSQAGQGMLKMDIDAKTYRYKPQE